MALTPSKPSLFFGLDRIDDPRLGELAEPWNGTTPLGEALAGAQAAILGWPDDRGIVLSHGRAGAAEGPDSIRDAFYRCTPGLDGALGTLKLIDLGNLKVEADISECHQHAAQHVEEVIRAGAIAICLGGGNDYAYGDVLGLRQALGAKARIGVINVDSHFDVRDLANGASSGTPYFRLLEGNPPILRGEDFTEFGAQLHHNAADHYTYLKQKGAEVIFLDTAQTRGPKKPFYEVLSRMRTACEAIVVSIDIDSVRKADAPGASASYPNGFSAEDIERIARLAGDEPKVKLFSIYEVSPPLDRDGITSALAASAVWHFLYGRMKTHT